LQVIIHDPLVSYWPERKLPVTNNLADLKLAEVEILVFTLPSREYRQLTAANILSLFPRLQLMIDANNVISDAIAAELFEAGIRVAGVGKGHWNPYWRSTHA
jgi:UDP-N-acetyl-D-mannosaminuronate dehydrogenase